MRGAQERPSSNDDVTQDDVQPAFADQGAVPVAPSHMSTMLIGRQSMTWIGAEVKIDGFVKLSDLRRNLYKALSDEHRLAVGCRAAVSLITTYARESSLRVAIGRFFLGLLEDWIS